MTFATDLRGCLNFFARTKESKEFPSSGIWKKVWNRCFRKDHKTLEGMRHAKSRGRNGQDSHSTHRGARRVPWSWINSADTLISIPAPHLYRRHILPRW